jgi:hypothetical protein
VQAARAVLCVLRFAAAITVGASSGEAGCKVNAWSHAR